MADDQTDDAGGPTAPRSRAGAFLRRAGGWLRQWLLWDARPSPAAFRAACEERDALRGRVLRLETDLAAARAEADAGKAEVEVLAAVVKRNEARVLAEMARAVAEREASVSAAGASKAVRNG